MCIRDRLLAVGGAVLFDARELSLEIIEFSFQLLCERDVFGQRLMFGLVLGDLRPQCGECRSFLFQLSGNLCVSRLLFGAQIGRLFDRRRLDGFVRFQFLPLQFQLRFKLGSVIGGTFDLQPNQLSICLLYTSRCV